MKRVILVLAVLSGLLCAGLVLACIYTSVTGTSVQLVGEGRWTERHGLLVTPNGPTVVADIGKRGLPDEIWNRFNWLGISIATTGEPFADWYMTVADWYMVTLPYWLAISVTAILPAFYVIYLRRALIRRHRDRLGLCLTCGYDLRGSQDRCPECGTACTPNVAH